MLHFCYCCFKCFLIAIVISSLFWVLHSYVLKFPSGRINFFMFWLMIYNNYIVGREHGLCMMPVVKNLLELALWASSWWIFMYYVYMKIMGTFIIFYDSLMKIHFSLWDCKQHEGKCSSALFGDWHTTGDYATCSLFAPPSPLFIAPPCSVLQHAGLFCSGAPS